MSPLLANTQVHVFFCRRFWNQWDFLLKRSRSVVSTMVECNKSRDSSNVRYFIFLIGEDEPCLWQANKQKLHPAASSQHANTLIGVYTSCPTIVITKPGLEFQVAI
ncbi:hypothetical protein IF1G_04041 [Cordyceps javanica]|uniref:Uncharacterized protein n=1 Tax=Cordyceps javanica TaxID=43265 RepID=A0A545V513_9HYPO|nr:hypothetical protein IF1G_04041 [Cordyceps javanica]